MSDQTDSELAAAIERLKLQGNDHYIRGEHEAAHHKYSEALKKDPNNPVLYANRAAACLAKKEYLDAASDCLKAVELDPTYAKAWGRLGTASHALASWERCIRAWKKALECLPQDEMSLTPAQKAMKAQFEEGLKKAQSASVAKADSPYLVVDKESVKAGMPWDRARALATVKTLQGKPSSAFVILNAYDEFMEGIEAMKSVKFTQNDGVEQMFGPTNALSALSNAIISDERTFHIIGDHTWPDKLTKQCIFENHVHKGWVEAGGPAVIKQEIIKRLKSQGWNAVRPSIAITIRVWLFNGFFRAEFLGNRETANELFTSALDILEWGRQRWPNVPKEERGAVFEKTFIRGIKRLKLLNMHKAMTFKGIESGFTMRDLVDLAEELIEDVDANPATRQFIMTCSGQHSSFWSYPKAVALSTLGWCHLQKGVHSASMSQASQDDFQKAAEYYEQAADTYPDDDENHPYFLRMSLDCLFYAGAPLKKTLPLCKRIQLAIPRALEIWEISSSGNALSTFLRDVTDFANKHLKDIHDKKSTMNTVARLSPVTHTIPETNGEPFVEFKRAGC